MDPGTRVSKRVPGFGYSFGYSDTRVTVPSTSDGYMFVSDSVISFITAYTGYAHTKPRLRIFIEVKSANSVHSKCFGRPQIRPGYTFLPMSVIHSLPLLSTISMSISISIIFITAISIWIILFARPGLRFRGPCAYQMTGAFNFMTITMFHFLWPLEHWNLYVLQHREHTCMLHSELDNLFITPVTLLL
jgi:hypothetical protein